MQKPDSLSVIKTISLAIRLAADQGREAGKTPLLCQVHPLVLQALAVEMDEEVTGVLYVDGVGVWSDMDLPLRWDAAGVRVVMQSKAVANAMAQFQQAHKIEADMPTIVDAEGAQLAVATLDRPLSVKDLMARDFYAGTVKDLMARDFYAGTVSNPTPINAEAVIDAVVKFKRTHTIVFPRDLKVGDNMPTAFAYLSENPGADDQPPPDPARVQQIAQQLAAHTFFAGERGVAGYDIHVNPETLDAISLACEIQPLKSGLVIIKDVRFVPDDLIPPGMLVRFHPPLCDLPSLDEVSTPCPSNTPPRSTAPGPE